MILLTGITQGAIISFFVMAFLASVILAVIGTAIYILVAKSSDNQPVDYFKVYFYILLCLVIFISFFGLMFLFGILPSE
jgi:uncharacterized BrkB/YihY/UPF0761 family membrane protein